MCNFSSKLLALEDKLWSIFTKKGLESTMNSILFMWCELYFVKQLSGTNGRYPIAMAFCGKEAFVSIYVVTFLFPASPILSYNYFLLYSSHIGCPQRDCTHLIEMEEFFHFIGITENSLNSAELEYLFVFRTQFIGSENERTVRPSFPKNA